MNRLERAESLSDRTIAALLSRAGVDLEDRERQAAEDIRRGLRKPPRGSTPTPKRDRYRKWLASGK